MINSLQAHARPPPPSPRLIRSTSHLGHARVQTQVNGPTRMTKARYRFLERVTLVILQRIPRRNDGLKVVVVNKLIFISLATTVIIIKWVGRRRGGAMGIGISTASILLTSLLCRISSTRSQASRHFHTLVTVHILFGYRGNYAEVLHKSTLTVLGTLFRRIGNPLGFDAG